MTKTETEVYFGIWSKKNDLMNSFIKTMTLSTSFKCTAPCFLVYKMDVICLIHKVVLRVSVIFTWVHVNSWSMVGRH